MKHMKHLEEKKQKKQKKAQEANLCGDVPQPLGDIHPASGFILNLASSELKAMPSFIQFTIIRNSDRTG
jgi:hypothetical protein